MNNSCDALALLERFTNALNERDLESLLTCFDPDYESDQPAHPGRRFEGRENVSRNWEWVFTSFPDFHAELLDYAVRNNTLWTEWRWTGTHASGSPIEVRGIMIFVVESGLFRAARLYLEPVEDFEA